MYQKQWRSFPVSSPLGSWEVYDFSVISGKYEKKKWRIRVSIPISPACEAGALPFKHPRSQSCNNTHPYCSSHFSCLPSCLNSSKKISEASLKTYFIWAHSAATTDDGFLLSSKQIQCWIMWFYQLSWWRKLATVKSFKANVSSVCPLLFILLYSLWKRPGAAP